MKAHPSIVFNSLSGTAGEVTARETKNGTVLSSRAKHSKVYTPAQKTDRAIFSKVRQIRLALFCNIFCYYICNAFSHFLVLISFLFW
ncbi:MAG: hypothetical protein ACOX32_07855 [Bacteroidaceae bacterium]|jgi:hypothetical protein